MTAGAYGKLLRHKGVPRLAAAFLALGTAQTMTPVAFVLFAHAATHSFATASLVLAASTAGGLLVAPARGRLVDRIGPRDAVLGLAIPDVATDIAFILGGRAHAATAILIGLAFLGGAVTAPAGTALRSVWSETLAEDARQAGYALLTILQETTFIAGPLVAGAAIALWSVTAAVATAAGLSFAGALLFASAPAAVRHERPPPQPGRLPALSGSGIRTLLATSAAFGLTFGVLDVAFPAFARAHGSAASAGVLLSAFAVGVWIGGFLYGLRPRRQPATHLYPRLCLLAAVGLAPLIAMPGLIAMVPLCIVSGLCFAPVTTCQLAVIDEVAQAGHRAEAFTWLGTFYATGLAVGAAASGQLIAGPGTRAALAVACVATLCAWLVTAVRATALKQAGQAARIPA